MKRIISIFLCALLSLTALSREARHIFKNAYDAIPDKQLVFRAGGDWFPYPAYEDRAAWEKLTAPFRDQLIERGEKALKHKWKIIRATTFLEFEQTKNRDLMADDLANRQALGDLTLAELAEGKGRFIMHLVDGLFYTAERTSWSHPQHTRNQNSHRTLPDPTQRVISLLSASYGAQVAISLHFFHKEFDKLDPSISTTIHQALDANIFTPYLIAARDKNHSWLGFQEGRKVNNWNTYCNTHVLLAFLLCENDPDRLLAALAKATDSVDKYMDYVSLDGACDEGPSYWNMAGGKVYEFAHILKDASHGKIDLLDDGQIRRMGEFKAKTYIGDGWVINFADGGARTSGDPTLIWRFGHETGSRELADMGLYLLTKPGACAFQVPKVESGREGNNLYRALETMRSYGDLLADEKQSIAAARGDAGALRRNLRKSATSVYYEGTEVAALRGDGWFLGAKGGHNGESHNHNDVGNGIVYLDDCPVLIDMGVAVYGKDTFGPRRYTLWYLSSEGHNVPVINGILQKDGKEFKAKDSRCDVARNVFSTDIAGAYPSDAACTSWSRGWAIASGKVTLTDRFRLSKRIAPDTEHFITPGQVFLPGETAGDYRVPEGEVVLVCKSFDKKREVRVRISYPSELTPSVEVQKIEDKRFLKVWGKEVRRMRFTSKAKAPLSGTYAFTIEKL